MDPVARSDERKSDDKRPDGVGHGPMWAMGICCLAMLLFLIVSLLG